MLWNNVPQELRLLPQWAVAGPNKAPINPRTGQLASSTDPKTWTTFDEVVAYAQPRGWHIGFVLAATDPYTIIDLDDKPDKPATEEQKARFKVIYEAFESYAELSSSGRGVHIIVRGRVPAGVHRDNVEVYSQARFMICTGNTLRQIPINDCQVLLDRLYGEMKPAPEVELTDHDEVMSDRDLVDMAMRAANGEKFTALCNGEWQALGYPSQSEADFALLSILAFYSQDNEQVRRLFRLSKLGRREKASKDNEYLNRALRKIRAKQPAPVDATVIAAQAAEVVARATVEALPPTPGDPAPEPLPPATVPPGRTGELAQYIYGSAIRPVPEVAIVGALGLLCGIVGRQWNTVTRCGLNTFIVLVGKTGVGKEAYGDAIDKLLNLVRPTVPDAMRFKGPGSFQSGQALMKVIADRRCFVSTLAEFGLILESITSPKAHGYEVSLRKAFLDLYSKSGQNKFVGELVYSDKEKGTPRVQSPAVTIVGESTPETFYRCLDEAHVSSGLVPRFFVVEYEGDRPDLNKFAGYDPDPALVKWIADLAAHALQMERNEIFYPVPLHPDAQVLLDAFEREATATIREAGVDVFRQSWNRAHENALRLATALAVADAPHAPQVTVAHAEWAIAFVRRSVRTVVRRFETGEAGGSETNKGYTEIMKKAKEHPHLSAAKLRSYKVPIPMIGTPVIPFVYFKRRLVAPSAVSPFNEKDGTDRLKKALRELMETGDLARPSAEQLKKLGIPPTADVYVLGPNWK